MALVLMEHDLGTTLLIGATAVAIMFIAGGNTFYMAGAAAAGFGGILYKAMHISERKARLVAFMDLEAHKDASGYQQLEGLKALGSGGLFGRGLGESDEKLLGFGLVINIALQACVNIGMTTALLPNKGMPLPFISYGGSNLCLCLLFTGILLNIYRRGHLAETSPVVQATALQARTTPRI